MVKEILQIGATILTQKTKPVEDMKSAETAKIVQDLLDTCENNIEGTAGLSAPQIGYDKSICVCRRVDLEEGNPEKKLSATKLWEVMINPEIIKTSAEKSTYWEGCLSIGTGKNQLFGPVTRPVKVTISYYTLAAEKKQLKAEGFMSHILQHEYDHLQGVLFLSHISNPNNIWKSADFDLYIDSHGDYPPIID